MEGCGRGSTLDVRPQLYVCTSLEFPLNFCFLRYVLYLESTISFIGSDYLSTKLSPYLPMCILDPHTSPGTPTLTLYGGGPQKYCVDPPYAPYYIRNP